MYFSSSDVWQEALFSRSALRKKDMGGGERFGSSEGTELVSGVSLPGLICFPVDAALCWEVVKLAWGGVCGGRGSPSPARLGAARWHSRSQAVPEKEM